MQDEVKEFRDVDSAAGVIGGALDRARQPSLFDRLDWFRLTLAHCPPPGRLHILRTTGATLVLMIDDGHARGLESWYALRCGPVLDGGGAEALAALLRRLDAATLSFAPMEDDAARLLIQAAVLAGWQIDKRVATVNWRTRTAGLDFALWWAERPARLRNTAERKTRTAGLDIVLHRAFDAAAWADYEAVYAASWKPSEGSPAFLRALAEQEGAAGTLRLGLAYKDGKPVAAQCWLVENGVATIHKLAYAEAARGDSPGTVLAKAMFRDVIERDRPDWIDFGIGDDPYKADWMEEQRQLHRVTLFNPRRLAGWMALVRARVSALVGRARAR